MYRKYNLLLYTLYNCVHFQNMNGKLLHFMSYAKTIQNKIRLETGI